MTVSQDGVKPPGRVVIACRIMQAELDSIDRGNRPVQIRYLDQGLHTRPRQMAELIQEQIDRVLEPDCTVVLGYGLCSGGLVGVTARRQGLVIPRCHDCVALFLGSRQAYRKAFDARPGTYYLTGGWIAEKKDPLSILEEEYTPRCGREVAVWAMQEELKHYTHIALIDTGVRDLAPLRDRALRNARFFGKAYQEIEGSLAYFEKMVTADCPEDRFLVLKPGAQATLGAFLDE